jgi:hypothetical protein
MPYLGNTPTTQSFISGTDYFNGTGAQTAFTLSRTVASVNDIQAVVNNVVQVPNDAYTISGTTITFTSAPSAGTQNVYVRYLSTTTQAITPSQGTVSWSTLDSNIQGDLGISFKNRIINGAMVIAQRGTGSTSVQTSTTYASCDRWASYATQNSKYTVEQSSTAPTGFSNSLLATSSAATSLSASDYYIFAQPIEGFNFADLGFGTAQAKTICLSFWVRSSLTGTFGGALQNSAGNRSYPFTYTISAANTWEQKSVTIAGDTSGTWVGATNGTGIIIYFGLGVGSTYSGTAGAWAGSNFIGATGATSVVGTNGATFYLTGVQLEVGTQATTFDYRSYGTELALCQRYFVVIVSGAAGKYFGLGSYYTSSTMNGYFPFPVAMRANPTSASVSGSNYYTIYRNGAGNNFNSITIDGSHIAGAGFYNNTEISGTAGQVGVLYTQNAAAFIAFQAEL